MNLILQTVMRNDEIKYIGIRLISSLKFLEFDDIETAKPCVRTVQGYKGCKLFLANIETVNEILQIKPINRNYREKFTKNYKSLFPDSEKRMYRVDVLEASIEGYTSIWVNGERFEFNSNVILAGKILYENWLCLITLIFQLKDLIEKKIHENKSSDIFGFEDNETWKLNIINTLKKFDECWVLFEEKYINELISIENVARRFVLNVHKYIIDNKITKFIKSDNQNENNKINKKEIDEKIIIERKEYLELDSVFFDLIKNLYRVLNLNNKDNISENINLNTWKLLQEIDKLAVDSPHTCYSIVSTISNKCKNELINLIDHIVETCNFPEKIDPHICNNINLQQLIIKVEESWKVANKYLLSLTCLKIENIENLSLVQLVKLLQKIFATKIVIQDKILKKNKIDFEDNFQDNIRTNYNQFIEKLEECDVGAFLALPKICCILYLINPKICSDIINRFLYNNYNIEFYENDLINNNINNDILNKDKNEVKLIKNQIFRKVKLINSISDNNKINEDPIEKMINFWNLLSNTLELYNNLDIETYSLKSDSGNKLFLNEELFLIYIFSLITGQCLCGLNQINNCMYCKKEYNLLIESDCFKDSKQYLNSFLFSIEEVSILLQRVYPLEWNEFIQIATICITKSPMVFEAGIIDKNNCFDNNNNSVDVFEKNSKPNSNNKFQNFLNNIGSIFYSNLMYYSEFNVNMNTSSSVSNDSREQEETFFTSSDSNFESSSIL